MKVYKTGKGKNVLIVAHDIFGLDGGRTKSVCDDLAIEGVTVYLPDFFRG